MTDQKNYRVPPHNLEAERYILFCMLVNDEVLIKLKYQLRSDEFYRDGHRILYDAILDTGGDLVRLSQYLSDHQTLEKVGGEAYLKDLVNVNGVVAAIDYYIGIVKELSDRRKLLYLSQQSMEEIYKGQSSEETRGNIIRQIDEIAISHKITIHTAKDLVMKAVKSLEAGNDEGDFLTTGLDRLNALIGGWGKGDLVIIAGRPSMGKTAFAINVIERSGVPGIFINLEMTNKQTLQRQLAAHAKIDLRKIRSCKIEEDDEWAKIVKGANEISESQLFYTDDVYDINKIIATMEIAVKEYDCGLAVIDYLQLIGGKTLRNRDNEIGFYTRQLKQTAKKLDIPIILLSQLNRECEKREQYKKRPMLSDLRESGSIEQDADIVIFIYRKSLYYDVEEDEKNNAEAIVAKARNDITGVAHIKWEGKFQTFRDILIGEMH